MHASGCVLCACAATVRTTTSPPSDACNFLRCRARAHHDVPAVGCVIFIAACAAIRGASGAANVVCVVAPRSRECRVECRLSACRIFSGVARSVATGVSLSCLWVVGSVRVLVCRLCVRAPRPVSFVTSTRSPSRIEGCRDLRRNCGPFVMATRDILSSIHSGFVQANAQSNGLCRPTHSPITDVGTRCRESHH